MKHCAAAALIAILIAALTGCQAFDPPKEHARRADGPVIARSDGGTVAFPFAPNLLKSRNRLAVHSINVGNGMCTLIECPQDDPILVDCGTVSGNRDAIGAYVRRYIANELIDLKQPDGSIRMRALVLSHAHIDHTNLIPQALPLQPDPANPGWPYYRFGTLIFSGQRAAYNNVLGAYLNAIVAYGAVVFPQSAANAEYHTPSAILPPSQWPAEPALRCGNVAMNQFATILAMNATPSKNAGSVVLRVQDGGMSAIIPGDAEGDTVDAIYANYELLGSATSGAADSNALNTTLLIGPHHGAATNNSNDGEWVFMTNPQTVLFPAGDNPNYLHPRCTTLRNYINNQTWRDQMWQAAMNCTNQSCRDYYTRRAGYVQQLVNLSTFPQVPNHGIHAVTCGEAGIFPNPTMTPLSIYNLFNIGTANAVFDSRTHSYALFCPETVNQTIPEYSCLYQKP